MAKAKRKSMTKVTTTAKAKSRGKASYLGFLRRHHP